MLTTIRENPERAAFIGVNVRALRARRLRGRRRLCRPAGALFGIFNRGVFADFVFWPKSAEVMIMTILGGMDYFWGPVVGAATLVLLNQEITSYTEYWPFVLGTSCWCCCSSSPAASSAALSPASRGCAARQEAAPMLEVRDLPKSFGGFRAVSDVELTVAEGEIAAVIGPNGAGKSTLFNLITGHLQPTAGRVSQRTRHHRRGAAQDLRHGASAARSSAPTSSRKLTVFENVQAALLAHRGRGREFLVARRSSSIASEAEALLASIGLAGQADDDRRHAVLRQPEAARARHRAGERSQDPAARRADRRHVGERDARDDRAARAHRRASAG